MGRKEMPLPLLNHLFQLFLLLKKKKNQFQLLTETTSAGIVSLVQISWGKQPHKDKNKIYKIYICRVFNVFTLFNVISHSLRNKQLAASHCTTNIHCTHTPCLNKKNLNIRQHPLCFKNTPSGQGKSVIDADAN